jgi:uncharacterized membrane protein YphA (DoxX/SURF4 family)
MDGERLARPGLKRPADVVLPIVRITLGVVLFGYGAQKFSGWKGGPGFANEAGFTEQTAFAGFRSNIPMVTSQQTGHSVISDSGRERRNRRILLISVVRLSPNLAAAPFGPPITQLVSRSV